MIDRKWQYKIVKVGTAFKSHKARIQEAEELLNRLGLERWELVDAKSADFATEYVLKRPL